MPLREPRVRISVGNNSSHSMCPLLLYIHKFTCFFFSLSSTQCCALVCLFNALHNSTHEEKKETYFPVCPGSVAIAYRQQRDRRCTTLWPLMLVSFGHTSVEPPTFIPPPPLIVHSNCARARKHNVRFAARVCAHASLIREYISGTLKYAPQMEMIKRTAAADFWCISCGSSSSAEGRSSYTRIRTAYSAENAFALEASQLI